jgi:hypothetical protein
MTSRWYVLDEQGQPRAASLSEYLQWEKAHPDAWRVDLTDGKPVLWGNAVLRGEQVLAAVAAEASLPDRKLPDGATPARGPQEKGGAPDV